MSATRETVGQRIRRYREEQGLTASELAEKAEVAKSYLSTLEHDEKGKNVRRPSADTLYRIAEVLGVAMSDLLGKPIITAAQTRSACQPPEVRQESESPRGRRRDAGRHSIPRRGSRRRRSAGSSSTRRSRTAPRWTRTARLCFTGLEPEASAISEAAIGLRLSWRRSAMPKRGARLLEGSRGKASRSAGHSGGAPLSSSFPASGRAFRAHSGGAVTLLGLVLPSVVPGGRAISGPSGFAEPASPSVVGGNGGLGGGIVDGHHRFGVKRTASIATEKPNQGVEDLNRRRRRSRCLCWRTRAQGLSARRGDLGSAWDRRCGLRPSAHRRAGVERAEPVARRGRARFGRSRGCLMQCFADELDLFTGFA